MADGFVATYVPGRRDYGCAGARGLRSEHSAIRPPHPMQQAGRPNRASGCRLLLKPAFFRSRGACCSTKESREDAGGGVLQAARRVVPALLILLYHGTPPCPSTCCVAIEPGRLELELPAGGAEDGPTYLC